MNDTISICYWPSGDWCYECEMDNMTHMSDDYTRADVDADWTYEEIDHYVSGKM